MITRLKNGQYQVKNLKQAQEALEGVRAMRDEIEELMAEHGIKEMQEDATELKRAATAWAAETGTAQIDLGNGVYARLRQDKYGGRWIATDADFDKDTPGNVITLLSILRRKFKNKEKRSEIWNRVTKRAVDPDALQRVVQEGLLTAEEIAPAFTEKDKAPFLIIYGE